MNHTRKKRILFVLMGCCLALTFLPLLSMAQSLTPASGNNRNTNIYTAYDASTVKSYLYADGGALVRVEYQDGRLLAERYSASFSLLASQTISLDEGFDLWGGFYAGEEYLFVIIGRENPTENDNFEVIRIIKYDKNWNRLQETGLYGANTSVPFDFGSLRCDEYGGILYIHTCHSMYTSEDGLNHQANMLIAVRQSDMKIADGQYTVSNSAKGYVSHSFNQFILADSSGRLVTLNHGDVYPRAAVLIQYPLKAGQNQLFGEDVLAYAQTVSLCEFPSNSFYQKTGASLGGLAETKNAYITAYNSDGSGGNDSTASRNVFLTVTDKNDFSEKGTAVHPLTSYAFGTYSAGTPVLVSNGSDKGYVLWDVQECSGDGLQTSAGKLAYATFDANGKVSAVTETEGMLSDCQPIFFDKKAVWYVTNNASPVFYMLDDTGLQAISTGFSDVDADSWYSQAVYYVSGKSWMLPRGQKFEPEQNTDRGTLVYALYQMENRPSANKPAGFSDVPEDLTGAVAWAAENGIVNGVSPESFAPYDAITREQLAALLYRYASWKGFDVSAASPLELWYSDAGQISDYAFAPMGWANAEGLITGDSASTLNPKGNATRAEIAAILMRFYERFC